MPFQISSNGDGPDVGSGILTGASQLISNFAGFMGSYLTGAVSSYGFLAMSFPSNSHLARTLNLTGNFAVSFPEAARLSHQRVFESIPGRSDPMYKKVMEEYAKGGTVKLGGELIRLPAATGNWAHMHSVAQIQRHIPPVRSVAVVGEWARLYLATAQQQSWRFAAKHLVTPPTRLGHAAAGNSVWAILCVGLTGLQISTMSQYAQAMEKLQNRTTVSPYELEKIRTEVENAFSQNFQERIMALGLISGVTAGGYTLTTQRTGLPKPHFVFMAGGILMTAATTLTVQNRLSSQLQDALEYQAPT